MPYLLGKVIIDGSIDSQRTGAVRIGEGVSRTVRVTRHAVSRIPLVAAVGLVETIAGSDPFRIDNEIVDSVPSIGVIGEVGPLSS